MRKMGTVSLHFPVRYMPTRKAQQAYRCTGIRQRIKKGSSLALVADSGVEQNTQWHMLFGKSSKRDQNTLGKYVALRMLEDLICFGEANSLRRPFFSQRFVYDVVRKQPIESDLVPKTLLDLYPSRDHEIYLGSLTFLSVDTTEEFHYFAMMYHGLGTNAKCWKWKDGQVSCDLVEVSGNVVIEADFEPRRSFENFLSWAVQQKHAEDARADQRFREKCVNGVYVESPELHPPDELE